MKKSFQKRSGSHSEINSRINSDKRKTQVYGDTIEWKHLPSLILEKEEEVKQ